MRQYFINSIGVRGKHGFPLCLPTSVASSNVTVLLWPVFHRYHCSVLPLYLQSVTDRNSEAQQLPCCSARREESSPVVAPLNDPHGGVFLATCPNLLGSLFKALDILICLKQLNAVPLPHFKVANPPPPDIPKLSLTIY